MYSVHEALLEEVKQGNVKFAEHVGSVYGKCITHKKKFNRKRLRGRKLSTGIGVARRIILKTYVEKIWFQALGYIQLI